MRRNGSIGRGRGSVRLALTLVLALSLLLVATVGVAQAASTEFRFTGDLYLGPGESVDSLVTMNGDITIAGHVRDTAFTANGDIHVLDGGRVDGDAVSLTGGVIVDAGGVVSGEAVHFGGGKGTSATTPVDDGNDAPPIVVTRNVEVGGTGWVFWLLGGLGLGLLLVLVGAGGLNGVSHEVTTRTARSAVIGLLSPLGLPILIVVLLISVIGIPLALLLIPAVFLLGMFGLFAIALVVGHRLLELFGRQEQSDVWAMVAGVTLLNVVGLIPVLGAIMWVVGWFVGFGATMSHIWEWYRSRRARRSIVPSPPAGAGPATPPPATPPPASTAADPGPAAPPAGSVPGSGSADPSLPEPPAAEPGPRFHI